MPLGALLALSWPPAADASRRRLQTGLLLAAGIGVLGVLEAGQVFLPGRYPDFADVILGGGGIRGGILAGPAPDRSAPGRYRRPAGRAIAMIPGAQTMSQRTNCSA